MTFDNTSVLKSKLRWNSIAKPLGGLGLLEDMVSKIAASKELKMCRSPTEPQ